jgi:hypothetical protein
MAGPAHLPRIPSQETLHLTQHLEDMMQTTCSNGRCPQPITLDKEQEAGGRCYFHTKVEQGLIVDYYEGVGGELVLVGLP